MRSSPQACSPTPDSVSGGEGGGARKPGAHACYACRLMRGRLAGTTADLQESPIAEVADHVLANDAGPVTDRVREGCPPI